MKSPGDEDDAHRPRGYVEIGDSGRSRRLLGFVTWALFLAAVAALLVVLFVRFTASKRIAIGLVLFMMSYMLLMGWWASRSQRRDRNEDR